MATTPRRDEDMLPEYDLSQLKGVRGKYFERYRAGPLVRLDPDVAAVFPDAAAVNAALRELVVARAAAG